MSSTPLMRVMRHYHRLGATPLIVSIACAMLMVWPLLHLRDLHGMAHNYPALLDAFRTQFSAGHWYPRWLPDRHNGYGEPTFLYNAPGFFYLALPFTYALPLVPAIGFAMLLISTVSSLGVYKLARLVSGPGIALCMIPLYLLSPPVMRQLDNGSFAPLSAYMLAPWALYGLLATLRAAETRLSYFAPAMGLAVSLAALVLLYDKAALTMGIVMSVIALAQLYRNPHPLRTLRVIAAAMLLGLILSAPYWWSMLTDASLASADAPFAANSGLDAATLFAPTLRPSDGIGLWHFLLALAGFALVPRPSRSPWLYAAAALYVLLVCFASSIFDGLRHAMPALAYPHAAAGMVLIAAALQPLGIALCFAAIGRSQGTAILSMLMAAAVILSLLAGAAHLLHPAFATAESGNDAWPAFTPRNIDENGLPPRHWQPVIQPPFNEASHMFYNKSDSDFRFRIEPKTADNVMVFNQWYFPLWNITVNDAVIEACPLTPSQQPSYCYGRQGLLTLKLPIPGSYNVHIWFGGASHWLARNALMALLALLLAASLWRGSRRRA